MRPAQVALALENSAGHLVGPRQAGLEGRAILAFASKRTADSDAALGKLIDSYHTTAAVQIAQAYAYRGERAKAFEWLDHAFEQKDPGLVNVKTDPLFANLHADPRFPALLRKMNLPVT